MTRKSADTAQSLGPARWLDIQGKLSPSESQPLGDVGSAVLLHERDEIEQSRADVPQLEPQTTP
jgi:hypothetical protein